MTHYLIFAWLDATSSIARDDDQRLFSRLTTSSIAAPREGRAESAGRVTPSVFAASVMESPWTANP